MKVYRYEKDLNGRNGNMFEEVSEKGFMYFAKTFEGAIMWGDLYGMWCKKDDGFISEYEISGKYLERQINASSSDCYTEIKIKENTAKCRLIKRTYIVLGKRFAIDENNNVYRIPIFEEESTSKNRVWKKHKT